MPLYFMIFLAEVKPPLGAVHVAIGNDVTIAGTSYRMAERERLWSRNHGLHDPKH
jgi:hypothetical protein